MVDYIEAHRGEFGVEPICETLQFAPSTYYDNRTRPPSARTVSDEELKPELKRIWDENYQVYGRRKLWRQAVREGFEVGRDRVARLMGELGISGAVRGKTSRTTIPDAKAERPADLVDRNWNVEAPNRLWVTDLTEVATWAGKVYLCFIIDVYSRMFVGWRVEFPRDRGGLLMRLSGCGWRRSPSRRLSAGSFRSGCDGGSGCIGRTSRRDSAGCVGRWPALAGRPVRF